MNVESVSGDVILDEAFSGKWACRVNELATSTSPRIVVIFSLLGFYPR